VDQKLQHWPEVLGNNEVKAKELQSPVKFMAQFFCNARRMDPNGTLAGFKWNTFGHRYVESSEFDEVWKELAQNKVPILHVLRSDMSSIISTAKHDVVNPGKKNVTVRIPVHKTISPEAKPTLRERLEHLDKGRAWLESKYTNMGASVKVSSFELLLHSHAQTRLNEWKRILSFYGANDAAQKLSLTHLDKFLDSYKKHNGHDERPYDEVVTNWKDVEEELNQMKRSFRVSLASRAKPLPPAHPGASTSEGAKPDTKHAAEEAAQKRKAEKASVAKTQTPAGKTGKHSAALPAGKQAKLPSDVKPKPADAKHTQQTAGKSKLDSFLDAKTDAKKSTAPAGKHADSKAANAKASSLASKPAAPAGKPRPLIPAKPADAKKLAPAAKHADANKPKPSDGKAANAKKVANLVAKPPAPAGKHAGATKPADAKKHNQNPANTKKKVNPAAKPAAAKPAAAKPAAAKPAAATKNAKPHQPAPAPAKHAQKKHPSE